MRKRLALFYVVWAFVGCKQPTQPSLTDAGASSTPILRREGLDVRNGRIIDVFAVRNAEARKVAAGRLNMSGRSPALLDLDTTVPFDVGAAAIALIEAAGSEQGRITFRLPGVLKVTLATPRCSWRDQDAGGLVDNDAWSRSTFMPCREFGDGWNTVRVWLKPNGIAVSAPVMTVPTCASAIPLAFVGSPAPSLYERASQCLETLPSRKVDVRVTADPSVRFVEVLSLVSRLQAAGFPSSVESAFSDACTRPLDDQERERCDLKCHSSRGLGQLLGKYKECLRSFDADGECIAEYRRLLGVAGVTLSELDSCAQICRSLIADADCLRNIAR